MSSFAPQDDADLKSMVRGVTGYTDTTKLEPTQLDTVVRTAKLKIKNDVGSTNWYSDDGLGQALLYTLAIQTKARMENHYLESWTVGDQRMEVRDATQEDSAQYQLWLQNVRDGLDASSETEGSGTFRLTSNYNF